MGDPRAEVSPRTAAVILTMWGEYVGIGLRHDEHRPYKFVSSFFVQAFEAGSHLMQKAEEHELTLTVAELTEESHQQGLGQRLLQQWWASHEVLLVCLADVASGSSGLLALRKTPLSIRLMRLRGQGLRRSPNKPCPS